MPPIPPLDTTPTPSATGAVRLEAARLAGAAAVAVLGQLTVDMPAGYFGPSDSVTGAGVAFCAVVVLLAAVGVAAHLLRHRRRFLLSWPLPAVVLGAFVAPLGSDPMIAGAVVAWSLLLLSRLVVPARRRFQPAAEDETESALDRWLARTGRAAAHLTAVSLVATTAVVGYEIAARPATWGFCLLLGALPLWLSVRFFRLLWRRGHRRGPLLASLPVLGALIAGGQLEPAPALALLAVFQLLFLGQLAAQSPLFSQLLKEFYGHPALLVLLSFVLLILAGSLLLSFPAAAAAGSEVSPIDALFTATSASCVTGLIVLDTPTDFSLFGQIVILCLIQVGGLNIMVLSTFATLLLGRGLGLRGEQALGAVLDLGRPAATYRLVSFIVSFTLLVEGVGAALLGIAYVERGHSLGEAAWLGLFHSVSAFCNAGFALHSDSLVSFQGQPWVLLLVALLIILGGLGFAVLAASWHGLSRWGRGAPGQLALTTQVKLVLACSAALVAVGTVWFALAEWQGALAGLAPADKLVNALFHSVTLRTAGFNAVDLGAFGGASILLMLALMFIGASPGGTGGGIKTTTAVVLLSAIPAIARREQRLVLFGRTIPLEAVYRSAAIAVIALLVIFGAGALLLASQPGSFESLLFETVSAVGTVGLSLGATADLDALGKVAIVAAMLIGRIGPLSLALLLGRDQARRVGYPEARIMVG